MRPDPVSPVSKDWGPDEGGRRARIFFGKNIGGNDRRRALGRYRVLLDLSSLIFSICPRKNILATPPVMLSRQGQCGGLPGQMFLLTPRQRSSGPIDRLLPNQSRRNEMGNGMGNGVGSGVFSLSCFRLISDFLVCRFPFRHSLVQMPPGLPGRIVTFVATPAASCCPRVLCSNEREPHTGQAGGIR